MPDGSVCQSGAVRRIHLVDEIRVTIPEVSDSGALRLATHAVGDPMQALEVVALYAVAVLRFQ